MKKTLAWIMALALLLAGAAATAEAVKSAEVGAPAPDFELTTLDGETFRLSDYRGKVVFLNQWATWCPPCVSEIPDIQKLADAHPDDLVVIGVSLDDTDREVRDFIAKYGVTYTVAMDANYAICGLLYPTQGIPYSAFITPDGVISSIDLGMLSYAAMVDRYDRAAAAAE